MTKKKKIGNEQTTKTFGKSSVGDVVTLLTPFEKNNKNCRHAFTHMALQVLPTNVHYYFYF